MDTKALTDKVFSALAALNKNPTLKRKMRAFYKQAFDEFSNGHGSFGALRELLVSVANEEFESDAETLKMATMAGATEAGISKLLKTGADL